MRYYKEKQTRVRVLEIFKQIFYNDSPIETGWGHLESNCLLCPVVATPFTIADTVVGWFT